MKTLENYLSSKPVGCFSFQRCMSEDYALPWWMDFALALLSADIDDGKWKGRA